MSHSRSGRSPVLPLVLILVAGCGQNADDRANMVASGGAPPLAGPGGPIQLGVLRVLSPQPSAVISATTITVRVQGNDWDELWVQSTSPTPGTPVVRRNGYPFGSDSFVVGVPLWEGACTLKVQGRKAGEPTAATLVRVFHSTESLEGIRLSVTPSVVYTPASTVEIEATYEGISTSVEAWLDADGDGRLDDAVTPTGSLSWTYPGEGYFLPGLVVRAANGIYYDSSGKSQAVKIAAPPFLAETSGEFELPAPALDLAVDRIHGQVLVLTENEGLHVFNADGALVSSQTLLGAVDLVAIDVDPDGDVYAVDRTLHQLHKFSRTSSYLPDTSFGTNGLVGGLGTAVGKFDQPMDVQCLDGVDGVHVWVADSGNQRLQRFLGSGGFQLQVSTGADIQEPITMVADFAAHVTVVDGTDGDLAVFEFDGTRVAYQPLAVGIVPNSSPRACVDSSLCVMVMDPGANMLRCYDRDGNPLQSIDTALSVPRALVHAADQRVLVAVAGAARLQRLEVPEPAGGSPVEVATDFFYAIHDNADATALGLLAPELATTLTALLADPVRGPGYRDLAGRLGSVSEISRSEQLAAVHATVDDGTPQEEPVVIELRRDQDSQRWLVLGL